MTTKVTGIRCTIASPSRIGWQATSRRRAGASFLPTTTCCSSGGSDNQRGAVHGRAIPGKGPDLNRILLLQGLRAAAALAVVVLHTLHEPYGAPAAAFLSRVPFAAGVDVFFVISGFVMVHASGRLFGARGATGSFLGRRLARIVPLYWAATTVFLLIAAVLPRGLNSPAPDFAEVMASYAFIPWPRADGLVQPVYSLGWTLNYEMFFYLVFSLLLPLSRVRAVASVACVLTALVVIGQDYPPRQLGLVFWTGPMLLEFIAGMGLAMLVGRGVTLPSAARIVLGLLGLALLSLVPPGVPFLPACLPGASVLVAAVVLGREPGMHGGVVRWMVRLGDASYALYLLHPFVLRTLTIGFGALALSGLTASLLVSATAVILACCLALISYTWFEAPLTRGLTAWTATARAAYPPRG